MGDLEMGSIGSPQHEPAEIEVVSGDHTGEEQLTGTALHCFVARNGTSWPLVGWKAALFLNRDGWFACWLLSGFQ